MRDLCLTEMVARISKRVVNEKLRRAVFHFRDVQAVQVEDEMKSYVVRLFNQILGSTEQQVKFWKEHLNGAVREKYGCDLDASAFSSVHKPALFHALQYHVCFESAASFKNVISILFTKVQC